MKKEGSFSYHEVKEQFDFFSLVAPPCNAKVYRWFIVSIASIGFLGILLTFFSKQIQALHLNLTKENTYLSEQNKDLKEKLHAFKHVNGTQNNLKHQQSKLNQLLENQTIEPVTQVLKKCSLHIQHQTWLSRLSFVRNEEKQNNIQQTSVTTKTCNTIEIEGYTLDGQELTPFVHHLSQHHSLAELKLVSSSKLNNHQQGLHFKLAGNIKKKKESERNGATS